MKQRHILSLLFRLGFKIEIYCRCSNDLSFLVELERPVINFYCSMHHFQHEPTVALMPKFSPSHPFRPFFARRRRQQEIDFYAFPRFLRRSLVYLRKSGNAIVFLLSAPIFQLLKPNFHISWLRNINLFSQSFVIFFLDLSLVRVNVPFAARRKMSRIRTFLCDFN